MFRSIKLPDRRVLWFSFVCAVIFVGVCVLMLMLGGHKTVIIDGEERSLSVEDDADAADFVSALGYAPTLMNKQEITVPSSWNALYASYDEMQTACGLGLSAYRSRRATVYRYTTDRIGEVCELIVCDGRIIAADLSRSGSIEPLFEKGE